MKKTLNLSLHPEIAYQTDLLHDFVAKKLKTNASDIQVRLLRRSLDARKQPIKAVVKLEVFIDEDAPSLITHRFSYPNVNDKPKAIIVGAGPAGMFAALRLIELGIKPILLERGKDVRSRTKDIADISRRHIVHEDSNYCFGEGGAGTYSDGKLYTRSKKRGDWQRILEIFVAHGADENILIEAHPHIGTNKLPRIVAQMRQQILESGGEVHFDSRVIDFLIEKEQIHGVVLANGQEIRGKAVILATGHSARDIFVLLDKKQIQLEAKPFALGLRIEHRQQLIDQIQYKCETRADYLPVATYSLVAQVKYRNVPKGVFSFCMCPGGFIVPSATTAGQVVVNGMSPSRRNSKYANSGIVVSVDAQDWKDYADFGALAGMKFQEAIEKRACQLAGSTQTAPAQRMLDFIKRRPSKTLLDTSYQPGLVPVEMDKIFPPQITYRLRKGLEIFGKKMKGYLTNEAQIVGVESRTSSPVRILRDRITYQHPQIKGLFPCGEGAGYAGGIASAAIDGEKCAEQLAKFILEKE